ncbi:hypothetical protein ACX80D_13570 [Arthrobacter sp. Sr24]
MHQITVGAKNGGMWLFWRIVDAVIFPFACLHFDRLQGDPKDDL